MYQIQSLVKGNIIKAMLSYVDRRELYDHHFKEIGENELGLSYLVIRKRNQFHSQELGMTTWAC